jgi:phosphotransferase family enzyme
VRAVENNLGEGALRYVHGMRLPSARVTARLIGPWCPTPRPDSQPPSRTVTIRTIAAEQRSSQAPAARLLRVALQLGDVPPASRSAEFAMKKIATFDGLGSSADRLSGGLTRARNSAKMWPMGWEALQRWGDDVARIEPFAGGVANDVWSVRINGHLAVGRLGARSDADLAWETELLQRLDHEGLPVPVPIPTTDGQLFADGLVVMTYVEGGPPKTEADWRRVADTLRQLHRFCSQAARRSASGLSSGSESRDRT